jgi:hypothetical protein
MQAVGHFRIYPDVRVHLFEGQRIPLGYVASYAMPK